jgi:hypothetical protein
MHVGLSWLRILGDLVRFLCLGLRSRTSLAAENLFLRKQLAFYQERKVQPRRADNPTRLTLVLLSRWFNWRDALTVVRPRTFIAWHHKGFRLFWRWKSAAGRRPIPVELQHLIRRMARENPLRGVPRIHGELLMLGIEVAESTVGRYMIRRRRPPSQGWKTFLRNHVGAIVSLDLFVVRTISFKLLYGLVVLSHARRRLVRIAMTSNPTAEWIAGQVTEAFPWSEAPKYLIRDRDGAFGPAYPRAHSCDRHPRSSDCCALAVAEWLRRTPHRIDSAREPRSPGGVRRSAVASCAEELRFLLQPGPDSSLI